jgi:predicted LPLAT superfamily acyltransferase
MLPVTAYFFVTAHRARVASRDYLQRIFRHFGPLPDLPRPPGWRDTFRHFQAFSASALDKFAAWSSAVAELPVEFPARAQLDALVASGRGAVLIGAHLGNFEMARALGMNGGVKGINAIVYSSHARRFSALLERSNLEYRLNLLHVSTLGADDALRLQDKIDAGELIFIVGDRTPASENGRITSARFLGEPAAFAQGPLLLAHLLGCPVYLFFCLRQAHGYRIHLEPFAERILVPRSTREHALADYVARYAARLEYYCGLAPLQWFNFFDFWQAHELGHARSAIRDPDHERTQTAHA